jgi:hypothetical protein
VSGFDVVLQQPTGAEDILLQEAPVCDTALALEFIARLARPLDGSAIEWGTLCVTDIDALMLLFRQILLGDFIRADVNCPAKGCGRRIDVAFSIEDYLAHHIPRPARGVERSDEAGWFRFRNAPVSFRLPSGADQVAIARLPKTQQALIQQCMRPANLSTRQRKRVEVAMEALAPSLSDDLQGTCSECGAVVSIYFDAQQFSLQELCNHAASIYEDIHLLALHYHWSQEEILALPRNRRIRFVEMVQQERILA